MLVFSRWRFYRLASSLAVVLARMSQVLRLCRRNLRRRHLRLMLAILDGFIPARLNRGVSCLHVSSVKSKSSLPDVLLRMIASYRASQVHRAIRWAAAAAMFVFTARILVNLSRRVGAIAKPFHKIDKASPAQARRMR